MPRKPPLEERAIILAKDYRRKYAARIEFQVLRPEYIGALENVTLLQPDGALIQITPTQAPSWEGRKQYAARILGFPTAAEAENAGQKLAQVFLGCAISLDFGLRLIYKSYEPATVYDRTASRGLTMAAEGFAYFQQSIFLDEFNRAYLQRSADRRLLLSMEMYSAAALESSDRVRFIMTVSALEPLAIQTNVSNDLENAIDALAGQLNTFDQLAAEQKHALRSRLLQLKTESVRQALKRLCKTWFPDNNDAWMALDQAYAIRSQLLHEGEPQDRDVILADETRRIAKYLRKIYENALNTSFRVAPNV